MYSSERSQGWINLIESGWVPEYRLDCDREKRALIASEEIKLRIDSWARNDEFKMEWISYLYECVVLNALLMNGKTETWPDKNWDEVIFIKDDNSLIEFYLEDDNIKYLIKCIAESLRRKYNESQNKRKDAIFKNHKFNKWYWKTVEILGVDGKVGSVGTFFWL